MDDNRLSFWVMPLAAVLPRPRVAFIPAAPYARALTWLEGQGHDRERILSKARIVDEQMSEADSLLSLDQVEAFVLITTRAEGDPSRSLDFGSGLLFPSYGTLGFAGLTAPNLGAALGATERFLELVTPLFGLEWRDDGAACTVQLVPRYRMDEVVLGVHTRVVLSSIYVLVRHVVAPILEGVEVDLPVHDPAMLAWMNDNGISARSGFDTITLRIPSRYLQVPFPLADAPAHKLAIARCEEQLAARRTPDRTIVEVRRILRQAGPPFLDLETVGQQLGASPRTVRRRLATEGTSFRELLDEARFVWAGNALAHTDRDVTAIAYDLGYSNPANFTRAFGRALGMSPSAFRRARLAGHRGSAKSSVPRSPAE